MSASLSFKERFQLSRFISGERPENKPVTLNQRRIFILPSKRGFGFVLLITVLLLIAVVYNNNLVYILSFLLAAIFFVSILHSYKSLAGLIIRPGKTGNIFAGETAAFGIHIENPERLPRINLHIKLRNGNTVHTDIAPGTTVHITLFSASEKRGRLRMAPITVYSYFPLGLFRCWSPVRFNFVTLVYPKPAPPNQSYPEQTSTASQQGQTNNGNDDFHDLRNYQHGDSIRRIHWRAFAKGQGLFIRHYSGSADSEIWLDYEYTPGNTIEERLSRLCRWVLEADHAGLNYGFKIPGLRLTPSRGAKHYKQCLKALALFGE